MHYPPAPALLTDLYQLTMAYAHFASPAPAPDACFHLHFRSAPFHSGFTLMAGLTEAMDYLTHFHFDADDLAYLATLKGNDYQPLFPAAFLDHLGTLQLNVDVDAIPDGT